MLCKRVQHVVQEANAGVDTDGLGFRGLRGVALECRGQAWIDVGGEVAAIKVDGDLDLGLVGVARDGGPAGWVLAGGGHDYCMQWTWGRYGE